MGCDIHLFTERKRNINSEEKWVNIDHWKLNRYYGKDELETEKYDVVSLYSDRNYSLFATLANVRNGSNNKFISEPKGLPDDCSELVLAKSEYWDTDGHSHSFFTLKELKEFREDNKMTKYSGMMSASNAALVDRGEMPNEWCKSTNIPDYVYREWEYESDILKYLIEKIEQRKKEEFWIFNDEEHTEYDDKIRVVFWFDN